MEQWYASASSYVLPSRSCKQLNEGSKVCMLWYKPLVLVLTALCVKALLSLVHVLVHLGHFVVTFDPLVQALELVLGRADTQGSQQRSAFTAALANQSIAATATVLSETAFDNDSLQDQIYDLTTTPKKRNRHLGAIIGSSVGSGVAVLLLAAAFVTFGRGWLNTRRLKKQTAAWHKV